MNCCDHVTPIALDEYRRRRDFSKTPELIGQVQRAHQAS